MVADTFFYEGDNVPDFRGAGPPPSPYVRIIPQQGKLTVRWNGYKSENTKDIFLGEVDFEGYRVYLGLDDRPGAMSPLASFDREDYNRYYLKRQSAGSYQWVLTEIPFTLDSLRVMFGNSLFDPMAYSRANPFSFLDSLFYFEPQDYNAFRAWDARGIRKVYPDAVLPPSDSSLCGPRRW